MRPLVSHDKAKQVPYDLNLCRTDTRADIKRRMTQVSLSVMDAVSGRIKSYEGDCYYVPRPVKGFTSIIWLIFTITLPSRDYDPYWTDKEKEVHIGWRVRGGEHQLKDRRQDPNAPVPAQRERAQDGKPGKTHTRVSQPKAAGTNQPLENKIRKTSTQASPAESIIPVTHPQIGDVPWSPNGGINRCPTKSS